MTDRLRAMRAVQVARHGGNLEAAISEIVQKANIAPSREPEDIANLAVFLISPQSRYLQGAMIDLDGGQMKTL